MKCQAGFGLSDGIAGAASPEQRAELDCLVGGHRASSALNDLPKSIANRISVDESTGCWLLSGYLNDRGYGQIGRNTKPRAAHAKVYTLLVGPIPEGLVIDHLCRVRHCVNPAHLEPVTIRENTLRGVGITARLARQTHCKHGHEFTPENTYEWHRQRHCKTCLLDRERRYRAARIAAKTEGGPMLAGTAALDYREGV